MADSAPPTQRLNGLTGMRALAAGSVGVLHAANSWPQYRATHGIFQFGYLAVTFFFSLSGFIMLWTWTHGGRQLFLSRRFARLWPTYMVGLTVACGANLYFHAQLSGYSGSVWSYVLSAGMIQTWFSSIPSIAQSWDGVLWSVSVEMFFYLCCPLLLPALLRLGRRGCVIALASVLAVEYVCQLVLIHEPLGGAMADFFYFDPVARLPEFICGALICRLMLLGWRPPTTSVTLTFVLTLAAPLYLAATFGHFHIWLTQWGLVVLPGFLCLIAVGASRDLSPSGSRLLGSRPMVWLGDRSYEFYVMHAVVLGFFGYLMIGNNRFFHVTSPLGGTVLLIGFLLCALLVAAVVHAFVERPAQRMLNNAAQNAQTHWRHRPSR